MPMMGIAATDPIPPRAIQKSNAIIPHSAFIFAFCRSSSDTGTNEVWDRQRTARHTIAIKKDSIAMKPTPRSRLQ